MPYTLMKGLVWILLAVLLGLVIGWLLRSVAANRQIERARNGNTDAGHDAELERLRNRVANLEPVVNERDRLRTELADARRIPARSAPDDQPASSEFAATADITATPPASSTVADPVASGDVDGATDVLGRSVQLDDLTVIEGIGPKIAELCHGIGIASWAELSVTEVSLLRTMLNDAGQRFKSHDPSTWPRQAGLLASGAWGEFKTFTDELEGGRVVN